MNRISLVFCLVFALLLPALAQQCWPNGFPVYRQDGQAQYPNGLLLVRPGGHAQFPNGSLIRRLDGQFQYPNGFLVKRQTGQLQLPDGRIVESLPPTICLRDGYWYYTFQCRGNQVDLNSFQATYQGPDFVTSFCVENGRFVR